MRWNSVVTGKLMGILFAPFSGVGGSIELKWLNNCLWHYLQLLVAVCAIFSVFVYIIFLAILAYICVYIYKEVFIIDVRDVSIDLCIM